MTKIDEGWRSQPSAGFGIGEAAEKGHRPLSESEAYMGDEPETFQRPQN